MPRDNPDAPLLTTPAVRVVPTVVMASQVQEMTFDYVGSSAILLSPTVLQALITSWRTQCLAHLLGCLSQDAMVTLVSAFDLTQGTVPSQIQVVTGGAGTVASDSYPGYVARVNSRYTALRGQHGRGRYYVPSVPLSFVTAGTDPNSVNAVGGTAYGLFATDLLATLVAGGSNWTLSITTRPIRPSTLVTRAAAVTSIVGDSVLGTIRRRKEGRGI